MNVALFMGLGMKTVYFLSALVFHLGDIVAYWRG